MIGSAQASNFPWLEREEMSFALPTAKDAVVVCCVLTSESKANAF